MIIRKAKYQDTDAIMKIIVMAQKDLKSQNINQWQNGYPNLEQIKKDIDKDTGYVLTEEKENIIIGTMSVSLSQEQNYIEIYDGKWTSDDKYAVVHRIAIDSSFKGKGLANRLLEYAFDLCRNNDVSVIRIDTHEDNIPMQRLLSKNGFRYCGIIYLSSEKNAETKRIAYDKLTT